MELLSYIKTWQSTPINNFTGNNNFMLNLQKLNHLITPHLSHNYSIKSTKEPIEILKTHCLNKRIISSLDVENSFRNVPVLETIIIIINDIYHHPTLPPLKINSNTLRKILLLCTTQVPFYDPHGNIYIYISPTGWNSDVKITKNGSQNQFWDPFLVIFTYQPLKIRFLIPSINLTFI